MQTDPALVAAMSRNEETNIMYREIKLLIFMRSALLGSYPSYPDQGIVVASGDAMAI